MPTLAYPIADLIARLQEVSELKLVAIAADLEEAIKTAPRAAPAVFVLSQVRGGAIKYSGPPIQQDRTTTVQLIVWVRNHGTPDRVRAEMDAVLAAIDARLAGWTPGNAFAELQFVASRDQFAHSAYLVMQALYQASWNFSANAQP